jgi:curli biogenesis system outer membrane secretion channel CsgG
MKKVMGMLTLALLVLSFSAAFAQEKPRLGVLRFTNQTHAGWWRGNMGYDLQDMLVNELASTKAFSVLERKEINAVLGEQDLGASGRIDPKTRAKIGKIKGAKYLVAATVSAFEESTQGTGGGIGIMGFRVGGKQEKAYMAVDLKLIDTETGEIADSRTVEATSESSGFSLGGHIGILSGDLGKYEKTPTGKAIRACIIEISDYLVCSLAKGKNDSCMEAYNKKESSRREKTKDSIKLE